MSSPRRFFFQIEPLEARIAPAVVIPVVAGPGKTGAVFDLSKLTTATTSSPYHTMVQFTTNYDTDANTAGIQAGTITIELFDDTAPLTVQNFLGYVNNANPSGNYDGTIIHRSAALSGSGPVNIIQGGGYNFPGFAHIPTTVEVHNEYGAANTAYTIAMAKGTDPNSATSEWFFNKTDNSGTLGTNNTGGFTVFGKVNDAASKAVIDGIAALTVQDFTSVVGSALKTLPLQNYNADPDNNPVTPKPLPTADQVIRIVDAAVLPSTPGIGTGLTYTVESITPTAGSPANLLTASIASSTLTLSYGAGKSGTADVKVKVSDGTTSVTDTFRVDIRPNFAVKLTGDSLPRLLLPGDAGTVKFIVANSGGTAGAGTVKFYLLKQAVVTNPSNGAITGLSDASPASFINLNLSPAATVTFNLASGKEQTFSVAVNLGLDPFDSDPMVYRVIAEVVPADTALTTEERFSDDNQPTAVSAHAAVNKFGTLNDINFGTRTNAVLKYSGKSTTGDAALATWTMKGPGSGTVGFNAQHENVSLSTQGTSLTSTLTAAIAKAGAHIALKSIGFSDAIGVVSLGTVDVSGLIAVSGGIKKLTLGNLSGDSLLLIGPVLPGNATKAAITLGDVTDFSIESSQPLASLTVKSWHDNGGANDTITAPSLGTLKVAGDFESNVTLTDDVGTTAITILGSLHKASIKTAANLGAVTVGGLDFGNVLAGVASRPNALGDFADPRTIQSLTVTGNVFVNSQVAAQTIGAIKVKGVSAAGGGDFGFVADVIKSYSRTGQPGQPAFMRSNLASAQVVDDLGNYFVRIL